MRERIIGRDYECERLNDCLYESTAQLIVVYGRRRVGKTFLINEFFDNKFAFKLTGAYDQNKEYQLRNFQIELSRARGKESEIPKDWVQAFDLLRDYLSELPENEKQVIFIDEMPWLDTHRSGFLPAFEWFWNNWGSARSNIVCIVCGSATSWMIENIADNKGGLFNRQTCKLYLEQFNLYETEEYLRSRNIYWPRYDICECYMIMGGIPYYLSLIKSRLSLSQNVDNLFFRQRGELWDEFDHLYKTLFARSENYVKVVETLSKKKNGCNRKELSERTGLPENGALTTILDNLISSGFVRASGFYGNKKRGTLYQLSDYYTAFYFRYIIDNYGKDEHFWSNSIDNPARRAWAGLTFEQLCKGHISQIKHKLGISGVLSETSVWYTQGDKELAIPGAQIDLLIDRRDRVINICEIKYSSGEFVIDKSYASNLRSKVETFTRMTKNNKSLQLTMITTYGVKKNTYSNIAQSQVTLDDLFAN